MLILCYNHVLYKPWLRVVASISTLIPFIVPLGTNVCASAIVHVRIGLQMHHGQETIKEMYWRLDTFFMG